jgi:hypothetical protein
MRAANRVGLPGEESRTGVSATAAGEDGAAIDAGRPVSREV